MKLNGGLGFEERFVYKWYGRIGIKDKLKELWVTAQLERSDSVQKEENSENQS